MAISWTLAYHLRVPNAHYSLAVRPSPAGTPDPRPSESFPVEVGAEPSTIGAVVGRRIRQVRDARGLTADEFARACRERVDLPWTPHIVTSLEIGRRPLTVEELFLLPQVLAEITGEPWRIADLFTAEPGVYLSASELDTDTAVLALEGAPYPLWVVGFSSPWSWSIESAARQHAEHHAARRLGTDPQTIAEAAFRLWGSGLTQERDRLVDELPTDDPRSQRGQRTAVTRQLIAELRSYLSEEGQ